MLYNLEGGTEYFPVLLLTSVSHEDLHGCVLQKVTSGENGPNLTEHPLPM